MPSGPIGNCWASGSWSDTAWEANTWAGSTPPVVGIYARRPTQRSAGARTNWRKIVVTNSIMLFLIRLIGRV